jgi:hypothetical protein
VSGPIELDHRASKSKDPGEMVSGGDSVAIGDVQAELQGMRSDIAEFRSDMRRFMVKLCIPAYVAIYSTLALVIWDIIRSV